jgi:hypothetical protein
MTSTMNKLAAISQSVNPKNGKTKLPTMAKLNLVMQSNPLQLIKIVKVAGYSILPTKIEADSMEVLILSYAQSELKDKETGEIKRNAIAYEVKEVITITTDVFGIPQSETDLVDTATVGKIFNKVVESLIDQPLYVLAKNKMVTGDRVLKAFMSALITKYSLTEAQSEYLSKVYFGYIVANPEYQAYSPKQLLTLLTADNAPRKALKSPDLENVDANLAF